MVGKKQNEHIDKALRGLTIKEATCVSHDGNLSFDPKWIVKDKESLDSDESLIESSLKKK